MDKRTVILKFLLFLTVNVLQSSAVSHSLQYFYTAITPGVNVPEFTAVGQVNGEPFMYYYSRIGTIPKTDWIQKVNDQDSGYWDRQTQGLQSQQENFRVNLGNLMKHFNQTKGVHTVQVMYGCELDDDGNKRGYEQFGYDGEDFISLDLNTETWTAPSPQAVITKQKMEGAAVARPQKAYLMNECIEWLKKYVEYGKDSLQRKVPPKVDLFQKDSSSPLVCHATGFFPKSVMIFWQKNGEDLYEDVEFRETLPNQDGTFQKRSILTVSPEELDRNLYTCVVYHGGLEKELVLQVSDRRVLSGGGSLGIIIAAVVAVLLLVIIGCVGVFIWKKKKSGFKPVSGNPNAPSEGDSLSNNS